MKLSLKRKLILAFLLLISIPMIISGAVSYNKSATSLQSNKEKQLDEMVDKTSELIELNYSNTSKYLTLAKEENSVKNILQKPEDATYHQAAFQYLQNVQKQNQNVIETLILADNTGKVLATSTAATSSDTVQDRDYFQKSLQGTTATSELITSKFTGDKVIAISVPIKEGDKVTGVLIGTINFEYISKYAASIKVGNSGYGYMLDANGLAVYHPKKEKILSENFFQTVKELKDLVEKSNSGNTVEGYYTYGGVKKFVAIHKIGNWYLVLTSNYDEYMKPATNIRNITILITILGILIAMTFAYFISTKAIVNPIKSLEVLMNKFGQGDLTVRSSINTKDEIGELATHFNNMIEGQLEIVKQVRLGTADLDTASEQMAASSEEISAATEEISAAIDEVAEGGTKQSLSVLEASQVLVQLSSLVQISQVKALNTNKNSVHSRQTAEKGRVQVNRTVQAMEVISKNTHATSESLKILNELSVKIEGIIGTINNLAKQTNLLALNAAIEAARAGEHGRGFTVVADEVRKLSEQSNIGANEIANLVIKMVEQTEDAVKSMKLAENAVADGVTIVTETDEAFVAIIQSVEEIVSNIDEIVDVTKDEVATSEQIVKLIDTMATLTEVSTSSSFEVSSAAHEQTKAVETLAATAEETSALALTLENLVSKFKISEVK